MTEPTLAMILRQAVSLCGTSEGAVRVSRADEAGRARAAYAWLASQLTTCSRAAIGLYIGLPLSAIDELVADVDGQVAGNAELREVFEVHAIELMAELGVRIRLGKNHPDRAPLDVARQVMAGGATAFTIGTAHLTHMASAFVAQSAELAERDARIAALTADVERLERKLADRPDPRQSTAWSRMSSRPPSRPARPDSRLRRLAPRPSWIAPWSPTPAPALPANHPKEPFNDR